MSTATTTGASPARLSGRGPEGLILASARLQLTNPWSMAWPWGILASSLTINLVVWALLADPQRGSTATGGLVSIFVVQAIWGFATVVQLFPFAGGLGLTRRAFALGAGLVHVGQAAVYALALTALRYLEGATGGFGLDLRFFRMPLLTRDNPVEQWLSHLAAFLLVSALGLLAGVVHHRWKSNGLFVAVLGALVAVSLVASLLAWGGAGAPLLDALSGAPTWLVAVVLPEVVASFAALAAFLLLRRAVP